MMFTLIQTGAHAFPVSEEFMLHRQVKLAKYVVRVVVCMLVFPLLILSTPPPPSPLTLPFSAPHVHSLRERINLSHHTWYLPSILVSSPVGSTLPNRASFRPLLFAAHADLRPCFSMS